MDSQDSHECGNEFFRGFTGFTRVRGTLVWVDSQDSQDSRYIELENDCHFGNTALDRQILFLNPLLEGPEGQDRPEITAQRGG